MLAVARAGKWQRTPRNRRVLCKYRRAASSEYGGGRPQLPVSLSSAPRSEPALPLEPRSHESLQPERGNNASLHQGKVCERHPMGQLCPGPPTTVSKKEAPPGGKPSSPDLQPCIPTLSGSLCFLCHRNEKCPEAAPTTRPHTRPRWRPCPLPPLLGLCVNAPRLSPSSQSAGAAITTKYPRLGGFNTRNLFSHCSGGWKVQDQGAGRFGSW